jgi:putative ABC transport system permease protein
MRAFLNGIRIAFRAILRNGLRASLTVLGILIGVASVVTVTALGTGVRDNVSKAIQSIGSNAMIIFPQPAVASGARKAQGSGQRLTEEDGRAVLRESTSVAAIAPNLRTAGQVVFGDKNVSTQVIGTNIPYFTIAAWGPAYGSLWEERDETLKTKVVVLGNTVKEKLFGNSDPIGQTVRVGRYPYRVVGVLLTKGEGPFGDQDDMIAMPASSLRARVLHTPPGYAGALVASATSAETTDRAVAQIDAVLRQRHHIAEGAQPDFVIRTQKQFQQMQERIFGVLTAILVMIAAISLVVGGIGIMNIMLVSVTERTREIGIRMAIGARENDIRTQFLVEAVVLAILGGLAGSALGLSAVALLAKAIDVPMVVDPRALSIAVGSAALIGVCFGFFPARRAAQLDPIEALRHE